MLQTIIIGTSDTPDPIIVIPRLWAFAEEMLEPRAHFIGLGNMREYGFNSRLKKSRS